MRRPSSGGSEGLQVHHQSYDRLGCELDKDLALLCQECHSQLHEIFNSYQTVSLYIRDLSDTQHKDIAYQSRRARSKKAEKARSKATGARHQDKPAFSHGEALRRRKEDYDRRRTDK
jgi:hypothetical protein